jgi:hypothetical protein
MMLPGLSPEFWILVVSIAWFAILSSFLKNNIGAVIPAQAGISAFQFNTLNLLR